MEEAEDSRNGFMQRLNSCGLTAAASSSIPMARPNRLDLPSFNQSQPRGPFRNFPPSPDAGSKRIGIPPAHPHFSHSPPPPPSHYPQISPAASSSHNLVPVPSHSRSLSQPSSFFNLDSLPQFTTPSPSDPSSSADLTIDDRGAAVNPQHLIRTNSGSGRVTGDGLPPRKAHRRSQSDIPFGFLQSPSLPPLPHPPSLISPREGFRSSNPMNQFVKQETDWDREADSGAAAAAGKSDGDDLFSAYMNLETLDTLNSSGTEEKREDSRASGTRTTNDSSENEAESSSVNESGGERREGNKRTAAGDPVPIGSTSTSSRHNRSLSIDSFMGKLNFAEESPRLPPSPGPRAGQHSRSGSLDGMNNAFSLEFGNGEFTAAEMKKIMANDKLAEIAMSDPKRAKRILANRQSAARSKERKMRYISELEHKVQTLQTEATTLSAQLTLLQRDSSGLTSQNNELKFRLQAMEQQAHLRDALNEALTGEVQRLKLASGEAQLANSLNQQMQLNPQMFSMQQQMQKHQPQQSSQVPHYQMQCQQQQQNNNDGAKHDSNK